MIYIIYIYILGILSILSPCTLIILPVLFSQIINRERKLYTAILFSLGLAFSFGILGAVAGYTGEFLLAKYESYPILFAIIITFIMALKQFNIISFSIPSLHISLHPGMNTFFIGVVFGFVSLSCISPLLGAVFVFGVAQKSILQSIFIFSVYSLGYSTPLIAASTILEEEQIFSFVKKHKKSIEFGSGALLLFLSIYLASTFFI